MRSAPEPPRPVPLLNVANALTMSRLLMAPLFLLALFVDGGSRPGWRCVAALVFVVAVVTDRVDGSLARRRGLVTDFGAVADPIADKVLTGSALVALSLLGELPWWVTGLIVVRELGVTGLRFWVLRYGVIPASRGGKAKTFAQAVTIGLYVLPLPPAVDLLLWAVLGVALVLTVATGVDYVIRALRLRTRARRAVAAT